MLAEKVTGIVCGARAEKLPSGFVPRTLFWLVGLPSTLPPTRDLRWPAWYVSAQMRGVGVAEGGLDEACLEEIRNSLVNLVESQHAYHSNNARIMRGVEDRIERLGYVLIGLAVLFAAANIIIALIGLDMPQKWDSVLMGLTAALAVLGAATFGIRLIGDFEGIATSSARTNAILADLAEALRHDQPNLAVLRSRARSIAEVMLGDLSHWLVATETRKLVEPG